MSTKPASGEKAPATDEAALDDRTRRALEEFISVIEEGGEIYTVVGENGGGEYRVDLREGRCSCPDAEYRLDDDEQCKHERRARFATGEVPLPSGVALDDVAGMLGQHVDGEPRSGGAAHAL